MHKHSSYLTKSSQNCKNSLIGQVLRVLMALIFIPLTLASQNLNPTEGIDPIDLEKDSGASSSPYSIFKPPNNNSSLFNNTIDYKDIVSLNIQLKSKSIIALLFIIALFVVIFRFSRRCDSMKQKLPKTLSLFWFFSTIQLYLDLNILQLDKKSYPKNLFIGISPIDHSTNYIPEVLHLVLFLISLFYFFALLFRFHELQGREDIEELYEQMHQYELENRRRIEQGLRPNDLPATLVNASLNFTEAANGRQQEVGGLVSQSLIQVSGLTWRSSLEFYHLTVIVFILFLTFVKLLMLHNGILFVRITSFSINTLDNLEMFTNSPRILALFTASFLAFSQFVGRTSTDKQQYFFQKIIPFLIVVIHSAAILLKRNLILTYDDIFCGVIFITSLCLYYTYESPDALRNSRVANPFLHFNNGIMLSTLEDETNKQNSFVFGVNGPIKEQGQGMRVNLENLSSQDRLRMLLKSTTSAQLLKILESSNAEIANSMTNEEIKLRKVYIEDELRKRREEHEEYLRQKKLMMSQKSSARYHSDPGESADEYEDGDGNLINDELDEDDYESSDNDNQEMFNKLSLGGGAMPSNFNPNDNQMLMDYIKKAVEKKLDSVAQYSNEKGGEPEFFGMSKQEAQLKFQQILLQQLNQQLNEESKKIINTKNMQGENQKASSSQQQEQEKQTNNQVNTQRQQQQKQNNQPNNTQGGQGQQNSNPTNSNAKGTAHKMPTKAPSGRPNQRKRR